LAYSLEADIEGTRLWSSHGEEGEELVNGDLCIYALLSRLRFPKSYRGKIFCIAFVNMQVPMVAMVLSFWLSSPAGVGFACQHAPAYASACQHATALRPRLSACQLFLDALRDQSLRETL
jgi:hypothetical protein